MREKNNFPRAKAPCEVSQVQVCAHKTKRSKNDYKEHIISSISFLYKLKTKVCADSIRQQAPQGAENLWACQTVVCHSSHRAARVYKDIFAQGKVIFCSTCRDWTSHTSSQAGIKRQMSWNKDEIYFRLLCNDIPP